MRRFKAREVNTTIIDEAALFSPRHTPIFEYNYLYAHTTASINPYFYDNNYRMQYLLSVKQRKILHDIHVEIYKQTYPSADYDRLALYHTIRDINVAWNKEFFIPIELQHEIWQLIYKKYKLTHMERDEFIAITASLFNEPNHDMSKMKLRKAECINCSDIYDVSEMKHIGVGFICNQCRSPKKLIVQNDTKPSMVN